MLDRDYMYAFDLAGRDVTLTIDRVKAGVLKGSDGKTSKKPLCHFKEGKEKKPLALNSTNCKIIAGMYGNDCDAWIGKRVTLYPTTCEAFGQTVDCIRVRPTIPKTAAAAPEPVQPSDNDGGQTA